MKRLIFIFSVFISVVVNAQVPTNGLIGYWPFNGNTYDESYNGLNGSIEGAIDTVNRLNMPGSAYYFNGTTDRILIKDTSLLDLVGKSLTISAWVKPQLKVPQYHHAAIVGKGGWIYDAGYELLVDQSNHVEFTIGRTTVTTDDTLLLNTYTHVVAYFDDAANVAKVYFNGVEKKTEIFSNSIVGTNSPLSIGKRCDGNDYIAAIGGFIDDVCIYNRALSAQEINDLYLYQEKIHYTTVTVTDTLIINVNLSNLNPVVFSNVIKVYPNPTKDHLTINFGKEFSNLSDYKVKIINSIGQSIYESSITQQNVELNLNNWTGKGLYFIHFMKGVEIVDIKKIILQ